MKLVDEKVEKRRVERKGPPPFLMLPRGTKIKRYGSVGYDSAQFCPLLDSQCKAGDLLPFNVVVDALQLIENVQGRCITPVLVETLSDDHRHFTGLPSAIVLVSTSEADSNHRYRNSSKVNRSSEWHLNERSKGAGSR